MLIPCSKCDKPIKVQHSFKFNKHFYCEACYAELNPDYLKDKKRNHLLYIGGAVVYSVLYILLIYLETKDSRDLKPILAFLNLPFFFVLFRIIFGDVKNFKKAIVYWITPNIFYKGGYNGEYMDAKGAEIALVLLPGLYYLIILGEAELLNYLFR